MSNKKKWIGIVGTGQSLCTGNGGAPLISTTQPFGNLKAFDATGAFDGSAPLSLAPMTSMLRVPRASPPLISQYPDNLQGETPHEEMLNELASRTGGAYIPTVVGVGGQMLADLSKGGALNAYASSIYEIQQIANLAHAAETDYVVGAVVLTHGEADLTTATYGAEVLQLQHDYEQDIRAITNQTTRIPILLTQQCYGPANSTGRPTGSTLQDWKIANSDPTRVVLVGPRYAYEFWDAVHMYVQSYERLGAKYAQVYEHVVEKGLPWAPLQPKMVTRTGNVIAVTFDVPVAPLRWNAAMGLPHQSVHTAWAAGKGFEVASAAGEETIGSVMISGDTVVITMTGLSSTTGLVVRYAMTQDASAAASGTPTGRWGLLCDSDDYTGRDKEVLLVAAVNGSDQVTLSAADMRRRTAWDRAEGGYLSQDAVVLSVNRTSSILQLSETWTGPTGTYAIGFRHDHRNYGVHFELSVP